MISFNQYNISKITILLIGFIHFPCYGVFDSADERKVYAISSIFLHSEPVSASAFIGDWDDALVSGENVFTYNYFEFGAEYKQYRIARIFRYDYILTFNEQTAELFYRDKNDLPIDKSEHYELFLAPQYIRSQGILFAYRFELSSRFSADIAITYLQGVELLDGEANVSVSGADFVDGKVDNANVAANYHYSEPELGEQERDYYYAESNSFEPWAPIKPKGKGFSSSLNLKWQATDALYMALQVDDLYHKVSWKQSPYTYDRYDYSPNVNVFPQFIGKLGLETFKQRLDPRVKLMVDYDLNDTFSIWSMYFHMPIKDFQQLGLQADLMSTRWRISYDFEAEAIGLTIINRFINLDLLSDDYLNYKNAHTLKIKLGIHLPF